MVVKFYDKIQVDIAVSEPAPANFVPAAAVIRRERALSIMTGHIGLVGGLSLLYAKDQTKTWMGLQDSLTGG